MAQTQAEQPAPGAVKEEKQSIGGHLRAMRKVLVISVAAVAVVFALLFYLFCDPLVDFVLAPVRARGIDVILTAVSEALMMKLKTCLIAAVVLAMPVLIWQVWSFIAPALYPREKRLFALLFLAALLLFALGVAFCCVYVFPLAIDLFWEASEGVATPMWSVNEYFNFVLSFVLPFGLMFELPVVVTMMARRGWVTYRSMARNRKYALLGIVIVAAVLTPPDVVSQCMLALPMLLLYEIAAQMARFVKPKNAEADGADAGDAETDVQEGAEDAKRAKDAKDAKDAKGAKAKDAKAKRAKDAKGANS